MEIINSVKELKAKVAALRNNGKTIGLVPTMGALHAGHASLVSRSVKENDATVPDTRTFSYPPTDTVMEGAFRPGHFNGVCQIVSKLFMFVEPDRGYFGEKDFQQIAVIKAMVADYVSKDAEWAKRLEICPCPIVREEDGLALSSRNTLLADNERAIAPNIYKALKASVEYSKTHTVEETRQKAISDINAVEGLEVQYYDIVNALTLASVSSWDEAEHIQGCITVFCGATPIRLIDNINYK